MGKELTYQEILQAVSNRQFKPIYVMMGEEAYYIDRLLEAIISNALPEEERDFCLTTLYGGDTTTHDVINTARAFPMGTRFVDVDWNLFEIGFLPSPLDAKTFTGIVDGITIVYCYVLSYLRLRETEA